VTRSVVFHPDVGDGGASMASLFGLLKPEIINQPCTLNQALNKARTKPKQISHDAALEKWECEV
jgi:hypothetical protein